MRYIIGANLIGCIASTLPAAAQVPGTYSGTAAEGSPVTLTVGTDAQTGALAVTGVGISVSAPCKGITTTLESGFGYGGWPISATAWFPTPPITSISTSSSP